MLVEVDLIAIMSVVAADSLVLLQLRWLPLLCVSSLANYIRFEREKFNSILTSCKGRETEAIALLRSSCLIVVTLSSSLSLVLSPCVVC